MIPNKVTFFVIERRNVFAKNGVEWALMVQFHAQPRWTIQTWDSPPAASTVNKAKTMAMRCFEVYHNNLQIPRFDLNVTE